MALERHTIEKKDFPIGRRGYDPDAVDSHLTGLADEVQQLKQSTRRRSETLASSASEQVRAIVEAAETSAADIQRTAEEEAQEIRTEAATEAKTTREQAVSQARDYVGRVSESTTTMLQRLDAMESELGALVEALRTGGNRLNADLQLLEGNLNEVTESVTPQTRFEPEAEPAAAKPEPQPESGSERRREPESESEREPTAGEPSPTTGAGTAPDADAGGRTASASNRKGASGGGEAANTSSGPDDEGARLIALNMALNGTPREETERYLEENFKLSDRAGLLDEVYASVES